ncbi:MAG: hypothetical protein COV69_01655 [Parcubacteria group bacterium CG11_big_fil_rev_8_21_14_0_20_39_14]|nr:MAG: hypothetical protein COV69_01655 [Parcubacteria group bacterium CG11_big_fil_rev_8_21_14_0_20_39_14]PIS35449.1 MAG: hypothetical protein COT36_02325 [Parcubacteria group bacterium CG08_land_8_20_14_0_20_38_56]
MNTNFWANFKLDTYFIFFIVVWLCWLFYCIKKISFWLWLWQIKEYRKDRMKAHFQLSSSRALFLNKIYPFKILLLFLFLTCYFLKFENLIILFLISAFYFLLLIVSLLFGTKARTPVFTQKAQILYTLNLLFFVFLIPILSFFVPLNPVRDLSLTGLNACYITGFIFMVFADIFLPIIVSFFLGLITPLSNFQKSKIIKRAAKKIGNFREKLLVIGITGSYGKTSTKEFLAKILSERFKVCKTEANNNTEIGVAKTILEKLNKSHEIFIVEMAAYKRGEIKKICAIAQPSIGILTGIGTQHFALFGSQENIIKTKYELIDSLPDRGLAVFNGDSKFFLEVFRKTKKPKRFYSLNNPCADLCVKDLREFDNRIEFKISDTGIKGTEFRVNLMGRQNVSNILGALLVAKELGIKLDTGIAKEVVQSFKPFSHTMELKRGVNGIIIIDDTYSANFEGAISSLDYLKNYKNSKKAIILHPLIELGSMAGDIHKKIGRKIGEICELCILVNGDFAKEIKAGAMEAKMSGQNIKILEKPIEVVKLVKDFARKDDVVLLENRVPAEIINSLVV